MPHFTRTSATALAFCAALLAAAPAQARGGGGAHGGFNVGGGRAGFNVGVGNRATNIQAPFNGANYGAYGGTYGRAWGTGGYYGLNNNPTNIGLRSLQGFSGAGAATGTLSGFNVGVGNRAFNVQSPYNGANYGAYGGTYGRAWGVDGYYGLNNNPTNGHAFDRGYGRGRGRGYGYGYGAGYGGYGYGGFGYGGDAGVYGVAPVNYGGYYGGGHGTNCAVTQRTDSDDFGHTTTQRVRVCN